jgi:Uncharacterized protein conserved in bacteria
MNAALPPAPGKAFWAIAEGYIPGGSTGESRALESHETASILNATSCDARIELTLYFADREPVGPYRVTVSARRTLHLRFNDLHDPERERVHFGPASGGATYPSRFAAECSCLAQHNRLRAVSAPDD